MTSKERQEVGEALIVIAELYGKALSAPQIALYCEALDDLDGPIIVASLKELAGRSRFFPLPADVRERLSLALDEQAEAAWVHAYRSSYAFSSANTSGDPTIDAAVVMMGGWKEIDDLRYRGVPDIDRRMAKKDFLMYFKIAAKRQDHDRLQEIGQGPQKALRS
jgi:hypothetical protein